MSNTARFGLPSPDGPENADVPLYIRNLATAVDPWLSRAQPRTQAQITAITTPLLGQQVYNSDLGKVQEWNGAVWRSVGAGASGVVFLPTTAYTANAWVSVSVFIGIGYGEVDFALIYITNPTAGFRGLAVSSAANAIGQNFSDTTTNMFSATDATTVSGTFRLKTNGSTALFSLRNLAYNTTSGSLTFEVMTTAAADSLAANNNRLSWRAR